MPDALEIIGFFANGKYHFAAPDAMDFEELDLSAISSSGLTFGPLQSFLAHPPPYVVDFWCFCFEKSAGSGTEDLISPARPAGILIFVRSAVIIWSNFSIPTRIESTFSANFFRTTDLNR
jgi:hypothetical protein